MTDALGMLEVKGYVAAIEFSDVMAKVADVAILGLKKTRGMGWMTIFIEGDVAAVQAAIQAAKNQAFTEESFVAAKVIPRPAMGVRGFLTDASKAEETADGKKDAPEKEKGKTDKATDEGNPAPEKSAEIGHSSDEQVVEEKKAAPRRRGRKNKAKTDEAGSNPSNGDQT